MPQNLTAMTDYYKVTKQPVWDFLIFYKLYCLHILWHMWLQNCFQQRTFQGLLSLVLEVLGGRWCSLKNMRFSFSQWGSWILKSFCPYWKAFEYKVELARISCKWSLDEDLTRIIMHFFVIFPPSALWSLNSSRSNQASDSKCTFIHFWPYRKWKMSVKNQYLQW